MSALAVALHALRACASEGSATAAAALLVIEDGDGCSASLVDVAARCGRSVDTVRRQLRTSAAVRHEPPRDPGCGRPGRLVLVGDPGISATISRAEVSPVLPPLRGGRPRGVRGADIPRAWTPGSGASWADREWSTGLGEAVREVLTLRHPEVRRPASPGDLAAAALGLLGVLGDRATVERWFHAAVCAGRGGKAHATGHYLLRDPLDYCSRSSIVGAVCNGWGIPPADRLRPPGDIRPRPSMFSPEPAEVPAEVPAAPLPSAPFPPFSPHVLAALETALGGPPGCAVERWASCEDSRRRIAHWARMMLDPDTLASWRRECAA